MSRKRTLLKGPVVRPPQPTGLIQVGITPDTEAARETVTRVLGWVWVDRVDEGVWNVAPPYEWKDEVCMSATFNYRDQDEIQVEVEWP